VDPEGTERCRTPLDVKECSEGAFHPEQAEAARKFQIMQYMHPEAEDTELESAADAIIRGDVRGEWIDRDNRRIFYRRRIVKDIRCNLVLGWLQKTAGDEPVVLTSRHPCRSPCRGASDGVVPSPLGRMTSRSSSRKSVASQFPAHRRGFPPHAAAQLRRESRLSVARVLTRSAPSPSLGRGSRHPSTKV
jgi:hypothetical protein